MLGKYSECLVADREKQLLINEVTARKNTRTKYGLKLDRVYDLYEVECDDVESLTKFCPKCNREYPSDENICFDCLVSLKNITDKKPVRQIESNPTFEVKGTHDYTSLESVLTDENALKIREFKFNIKDYKRILKNIKKISLTHLDCLIKKYYVDLNDIKILDKILLYTKSFTNVKFKSYGQELGYFEANTIVIDDRQLDSLQITTLIHELSHFILKEIISEILSKLLDCNKNTLIEDISEYILSYSNFTALIDEYAAHCCEGRFSVYGYQDYSSFLNIIKMMDGEMSSEDIEITKSIGNNFANSIKDILESFIDDDMLKEIKELFLLERVEEPNYEMLALENCNILTDEAFMHVVRLILCEGFTSACENIKTINSD